MSNIFMENGKYWFWDEAGLEKHGPFEDESSAQFGITCYESWLSGKCVTCRTPLNSAEIYKITSNYNVAEPVCQNCAYGARLQATFIKKLTGVLLKVSRIVGPDAN